MTLLIALMLNFIVQHISGEVWCSNIWIVILWVLHVIYHGESSK